MSKTGQNRTCATCGTTTDAHYCAADHSPTIVAQPPLKALREYRTGDLIGDRYRIIEPLGKGATAIVFATEHIGTGVPIAVKLLSVDPTEAEGMTAVRRFLREARVTASLQHPNTVLVYDAGQDEAGAFFLAMERLSGETLDRVLQRKLLDDEGMTQAEVIEVALPILSALEAAHERGLVHRDLKPANIMLSLNPQGEEVLKVLDFGVARTAGSMLTRGGQMPGAPKYMSPEQCRGKQVDGRSDLYSLGCLMYTCVACEAPYDDREPMRIMQKHVLEPIPDLRKVSKVRLGDAFVELIQSCLAKEPVDRPQSAKDMVTALERLRARPRTRVESHRHMGSGSTDPRVQAKALARMAEQASEPAQAFQYARAAMNLDPRNLAYRQLARRTQAGLGPQSGSSSQHEAAVPPPPPPAPKKG